MNPPQKETKSPGKKKRTAGLSGSSSVGAINASSSKNKFGASSVVTKSEFIKLPPSLMKKTSSDFLSAGSLSNIEDCSDSDDDRPINYVSSSQEFWMFLFIHLRLQCTSSITVERTLSGIGLLSLPTPLGWSAWRAIADTASKRFTSWLPFKGADSWVFWKPCHSFQRRSTGSETGWQRAKKYLESMVSYMSQKMGAFAEN